MPISRKSLLERVARGISRPGGGTSSSGTASILAQAARAYATRPDIDDATFPTGFDPTAAALFEAIIEAAFLVANSDGVFDEDERESFQSIVSHACLNMVQTKQLEALIADFCEQLAEDGIEKRAHMVARTIIRREHQLEVLRIASLMAHVSGGVSAPERAVLEHLARGFQLEAGAVDAALKQAALALKLD